MAKKLANAIVHGYLEDGTVEALTRVFPVPKGPTDIRMVHDGTKSGLNESLWAPWFPLPTVECLLRSMNAGTFMADNDVGDLFLNFHMNHRLRLYCGVDLTHVLPRKGGGVNWKCWGRCGIGFTNSPYQTIQAMLIAEEFIQGNRHDTTNQ